MTGSTGSRAVTTAAGRPLREDWLKMSRVRRKTGDETVVYVCPREGSGARTHSHLEGSAV